MTKTKLLARAGSLLSSDWNEYLCVESLAEGMFQLSNCRHETIGSIYDLLRAKRIYDKNGEFRLPKSVGGKRIIGLRGGEYLLIDELYEAEISEAFDTDSIEMALEFCERQGWSGLPGFEDVWSQLNMIVDGDSDGDSDDEADTDDDDTDADPEGEEVETDDEEAEDD